MENQSNTATESVPQVDQNPVVQPVATAKTNYLTIGGVALICSLIFGVGGYYLGKQSLNSPYVNSEVQANPTTTPKAFIETSSTPPSVDNSNQKNIYSNQYFSFEYPKSWQIDNNIIYEHRSSCDPETSRCLNEKNIVDIRSNLTQIYQGYTNPQWFNKIASLNSPWEIDRDVFTKLASEQTQSGKAYLIFKQGPSASFEGEPLTLIIGYVLSENNIYELRLSRFSSETDAVKLLKSMIETLKIK